MDNKILYELKGVKENVLLKNYTTYKIGGNAKYFFIAKTKEELIKAIELAKKYKIYVFIMGGGSNLLISDKGFNGLVIKIDISDIDIQGNNAVVGAGTNITKLSYLLAEKGLSGLEWAAGMPGTVGGAIYGHAQAFGAKISMTVKTVEVLNLSNLKTVSLSNKQCNFSLKNSVFKKNKKLVIVSAVLNFKLKEPEEAKKQIKENLEYRRTRHPYNFPSAGSVFVNPEVKIKNKKILEKFPELKEFNENGIIPAGYLIAKSGLSGKKIGGAQISEKHSNFIINIKDAKAKDILALINLAKKSVKKNFNVILKQEVQMVGFRKK